MPLQNFIHQSRCSSLAAWWGDVKVATDTIGTLMLYVSKCLAPSNEPGDFIDFSVDFEVFEALRNDRKFIHAWWGEQGVGDFKGEATPEYYEQLFQQLFIVFRRCLSLEIANAYYKKLLEQMLMKLEQGQWHILSLWEGPKKHSQNATRSWPSWFLPVFSLIFALELKTRRKMFELKSGILAPRRWRQPSKPVSAHCWPNWEHHHSGYSCATMLDSTQFNCMAFNLAARRSGSR